ncbi:MAG: hypothetical protein PHT12_06100, partial [Patescibacteria group bacterium]|nr:hypothetical protein [Patescibacteria group bacterium]
RLDASIDVSRDQSQTFSYDVTLPTAAGADTVLYLKVQINPLVPSGEGYKATLVISGTTLVDPMTGLAVAYQPTTDLAGSALTTLNDAMEVSASSVVGQPTYVRGAKDVGLGALSFKATTAAPNVIKTLTLTAYYDSEGIGGFAAGGDADGGVETRARDLVSKMSLYDSKGVKVAGPVDVGFDGRVTFSGLNFAIIAGQSATLTVRGDLSPTINLGSQPDRLSVELENPADVTVTDDQGQAIMVRGTHPNGGNQATYFITVRTNGTVKFSWSGSGGNLLAGDEVSLGEFRAETKYDAYTLRVVSFRQVGGVSKSLTDVRLEYKQADGKTASVSQQLVGGNVTFSGLAVPLGQDKITSLRLYGDLAPRDGGAVYGEKISVAFGNVDALEFVSASDGHVFTEKDLGTGDFTVTANTAGSGLVRWSTLTVAKAEGVPATVYHDVPTEVLRFTVKADAHGAVRLRQLTFYLKPSDVKTTGANNDSLESWASINGDFANDYGVAELTRYFDSTTKEVLGKYGSATMQYSIVRGGVKITNPVAQNYVSAVGDYGMIEYKFNEGSEISIPAGATQEFRFAVDTSWFPSDKKYSLETTLVGGTSFLWTDVTSGAYTALTGSDAIVGDVKNAVTVSN